MLPVFGGITDEWWYRTSNQKPCCHPLHAIYFPIVSGLFLIPIQSQFQIRYLQNQSELGMWWFPEIGLPPNHHPFRIGIFPEINHPAIGVPPWLWKAAYLDFPWISHCYPISRWFSTRNLPNIPISVAKKTKPYGKLPGLRPTNSAVHTRRSPGHLSRRRDVAAEISGAKNDGILAWEMVVESDFGIKNDGLMGFN